MRLLHHIRSLPKRTQAHVAFIIAFILAVIIALLWIPTLPARFAPTKDLVNEATGQAENETAIGSVFKDIASSTTQIRDIFKTTETGQQQEQPEDIYIYEPEQTTSTAPATNN